MKSTRKEFDPKLERDCREISASVAEWFVRKDNKFFDVSRPHTPLSRNDVQRMILHRIKERHADIKLNSDLINAVFDRAIIRLDTPPDQSIPVWTGEIGCNPGQTSRLVWSDGAVIINSWEEPDYRRLRINEAEFGIVAKFLDTIFPRKAEREMFLDWLAWCLQNEDDKPTWGPLLYSSSKGTGKSTLCQLLATLFGESNSVTQNNVDLLTGRFNMTVLRSKLVISEELQLKPGSKSANMLKTYLTETTALSEMKGREAERISQRCCFIFTTNDLPSWIESDDRRFYVIEVDHDGHASGAGAREFSQLVAQTHAFMNNPNSIAKLYKALMERPISAEFSAKTLNINTQATDIMRRLNAGSEQSRLTMLREELARLELHAIPERELAAFACKVLRCAPEQPKHLMMKLGWSKTNVKWDSIDYVRALWVREGFTVSRGFLSGPKFERTKVEDHIMSKLSLEMEEIEYPV